MVIIVNVILILSIIANTPTIVIIAVINCRNVEVMPVCKETFSGQDIIRSFNQEDNSFEIFKKDYDKWYDFDWKSKFYSSFMCPVINFISNLSYVIIAVLGAIFVLQRAMLVGDILAFFQYGQQ